MFWTTATAAEFLRGTSDGVFVSSEGVVSPGPLLTSRLTSAPTQVWSLIEAADGTLLAGTGGDGRVLRLRTGQPDATVFDADESNIFALAAAGDRVYAASSPDGKVYVIEGTSAARVFFDPDEEVHLGPGGRCERPRVGRCRQSCGHLSRRADRPEPGRLQARRGACRVSRAGRDRQDAGRD